MIGDVCIAHSWRVRNYFEKIVGDFTARIDHTAAAVSGLDSNHSRSMPFMLKLFF